MWKGTQAHVFRLRVFQVLVSYVGHAKIRYKSNFAHLFYSIYLSFPLIFREVNRILDFLIKITYVVRIICRESLLFV